MPLAMLLIASKDTSPNLRDVNGRTPLSWAAEKGHEGFVTLLLAAEGIDANSKDGSGQTPLFYALRSGYAAIDRSLCVKGPSIVAKDKDAGLHYQMQ
ncbi:ankyrin repeat-containing domain protein [Fusarium oxysporum]|nr:ankyrin repeat-containing domain protein [Fusarium oxysporum]